MISFDIIILLSLPYDFGRSYVTALRDFYRPIAVCDVDHHGLQGGTNQIKSH